MGNKEEMLDLIFFNPLNSWNQTAMAQAVAAFYYIEGMNNYSGDFIKPLLMATDNFSKVEATRFQERNPQENFKAYNEMFLMNWDLLARYNQGVLETLGSYSNQQLERFLSACHATLFSSEAEKLDEYFLHHEGTLRKVLEAYPEAITKIEPEFGFHFERYPESLIAESDRFYLRQVNPTEEGVETDDSMKPILIIPPAVLGANILAFLPKQKKSYAHSFANKGIPTYIRITKDIDSNQAVQTMSLEDDALDTKFFCEEIMAKHGQKITLNGYCQGGFTTVCNVLTGKLDPLVDALITCVAPMDGTRSDGLGKFLKALPAQFNDLVYGSKTLASGNKVANGDLMGWVYKLKSMENSGPIVAFIRDIMMLNGNSSPETPINKTVAAINYWLQNERSDLPLSVTEMSFSSFNTSVKKDGTLPITMFGKKLNFKAMNEKDIQWLICYGEKDDLVEKEVALAPLDFVDAEVTPFPKGHVAIATSWSHPESSCALDSVFGKEKYRGPVRFHLDMQKKPEKETAPKS
ncbi:MAG: metal transporter [Desulfobulbaceae bacterium]|nr:metal transporter [Desulfobulbaceae bacterium]